MEEQASPVRHRTEALTSLQQAGEAGPTGASAAPLPLVTEQRRTEEEALRVGCLKLTSLSPLHLGLPLPSAVCYCRHRCYHHWQCWKHRMMAPELQTAVTADPEGPSYWR